MGRGKRIMCGGLLEGPVSIGGLEYTIQTLMHYLTLSQACNCHSIFVGEVIIIIRLKMTVWT